MDTLPLDLTDLVSSATDHTARLQATRSVVGPAPVFVGPSAAWAWGSEMGWPDDPIHINVSAPHALAHRSGLRVHQGHLDPHDVTTSRFGPTTTVARTAIDLARSRPRTSALAALDALARVRPLDLADLTSRAHALKGRRGIRQARELLPLVDARAESPRESMLRLAVHDHGLAAPEPQLEVYDAWGRFVARLDLGWRRQRVGLEYDGAVHRDRAVHGRDLARHNDLRDEGWLVFQVGAAGWASRYGILVAVESALRSRAPRRDGSP